MPQEQLPVVEVQFEEARKLADLASIYQDLSYVVDALERLKVLLDEDSDDHVLIQSYWTAALISYVRCFSTGKRLGLSESIFDSWDGAAEVHQFYRNLRDKHIAHSVNPFEQIVVGLVLSAARGEGRGVEGVATLSQKLIAETSEGVETLLRLAKFAHGVVARQAKEYEKSVLEIGKNLAVDGLYSKASLRTVTPGPQDSDKARR